MIATAPRWSGAAAGLAVGGCLTWNVSNVGAVADPLAEQYDGLVERIAFHDSGLTD